MANADPVVETATPSINYLVELFLELVAIPSPPGRERAMADRVAAEFDSIGVTWNEDDAGRRIGGDTGNLIAHIPATTSAPRLLFCAHLDTVPEPEPIVPIIDEGVIRSSGPTILAADNKAAVATLLVAARAVIERGAKHGGIDFIFTPMEELGCRGAHQLEPSELKAKLGYVFDYADEIGVYVRSAPSGARLDIEFIGQAAHAGISPENGRSAVAAAATAVAAMPIGRTDEDATVNVGLINGGTAHNVVPERCSITVDVRARSAVQNRHLTDALTEICERAAESHGCRLNVEREQKYLAYDFEPDAPVVTLASRAMKRLDIEAVPVDGGGGSDASAFNAAGLPCLNLANAMADIHTSNEHIAIRDLALMLELTLMIVDESTAA